MSLSCHAASRTRCRRCSRWRVSSTYCCCTRSCRSTSPPPYLRRRVISRSSTTSASRSCAIPTTGPRSIACWAFRWVGDVRGRKSTRSDCRSRSWFVWTNERGHVQATRSSTTERCRPPTWSWRVGERACGCRRSECDERVGRRSMVNKARTREPARWYSRC